MMNVVFILGGLILTGNVEVLEDPAYNARGYVQFILPQLASLDVHTDNAVNRVQFLWWCGIPTILFIINVAEGVKLYKRTLRPKQVIITSCISIVVCVGLLFFWQAVGLTGSVTWPDSMGDLAWLMPAFTFASDALCVLPLLSPDVVRCCSLTTQ